MTAVLQFSPHPRKSADAEITASTILDMRTRIALLGAHSFEERQAILIAAIHRKISELTTNNVIAFKGAA